MGGRIVLETHDVGVWEFRRQKIPQPQGLRPFATFGDVCPCVLIVTIEPMNRNDTVRVISMAEMRRVFRLRR
jgi:hypothetical protein